MKFTKSGGAKLSGRTVRQNKASTKERKFSQRLKSDQ
ncbi:hypothetical protein SCG7109_AB_00400 [Chlamydiales bacterium SCGC AG-110-M15]|nr:hypothetical protein SCG7109_AB_00400 [Chlamydiales bacterium SCGC AG-110-M15]